MTFAEMGDMLRAERMRRNLSIEEVAELLKLSPRLIRGIEAGDESALPHTVYVRGFVRSYARLLEIELESIAEQPIIFATESAEPAIQTRPMQAPRTNWGLRLLVLVCALGFAGYWYYHTQLSTPQTQVAVPPTSMAPSSPMAPGQGALGQNLLGQNILGQDRGGRATTAPTDTGGGGGVTGSGSGTSILSGLASGPAQAMSSGTASAAQQGGVQAGSPLNSQTPQLPQTGAGGSVAALAGNGAQPTLSGQLGQAGQAGQAGQLGQPLSDAHLAAAEEAPVATRGFSTNGLEVPVSGGTNSEAVRIGIPSSVPAGEEINQLMLTGVAECWVHTTADSTETRQFSIQKGETFSLSFNKNLVVKLGNAGGVRMKYNGADLPAPGKEGQVLTLQFPQAAGR